LSTLDTSTEQTVEWAEFQTVDCGGLETFDGDDVSHRLRDPWLPRHTFLECRWVQDEASDGRLISVWCSRPR
jgi:hypothetical protein